MHQKRAEASNARRREPPALKVGSKVWYKPQRQPGVDKVDALWKGPALVVARKGEHSYIVEIQQGKTQEAHRSQLQPHIHDGYNGKPMPMWYTSGKAHEIEATPDEYDVEEVMGHRKDAKGKLQFLVRWKDWDPTDQWLQPVANFFPQYNALVVEYCRKKG